VGPVFAILKIKKYIIVLEVKTLQKNAERIAHRIRGV
jgi:hypothetical protein